MSQYVQYLPIVVGELFCRVWTRRCTMGCWWWLCVSANLPFSWTRNSNSAARMSPQSSRCWRSGLVVARLLHGDTRSYPRPTYFCSARFPLYWQILLSQIVGPGCCLVSLHSPSHSSWFACFNAQLSAPPTALARYHHVVRSLDPLFHLADEPPNPFVETRCSTSSPVLVGETSRIYILLVGWLSSCTGNVEFFAQSRTFVLAVQAFSMQASPLFEVTTEYSDRQPLKGWFLYDNNG